MNKYYIIYYSLYIQWAPPPSYLYPGQPWGALYPCSPIISLKFKTGPSSKN